MAQYAYFDHTAPDPKPVKGWFDVAQFKYATLPDQEDLMILTAAQWEARMSDPSRWVISGGNLVFLSPQKDPVSKG